MTYILDRFENDIAVLVSKDGDTLNAERDALAHPSAKEGDVFLLVDGKFLYSESETAARRERIGSKFARLVKNRRKKDTPEG